VSVFFLRKTTGFCFSRNGIIWHILNTDRNVCTPSIFALYLCEGGTWWNSSENYDISSEIHIIYYTFWFIERVRQCLIIWFYAFVRVLFFRSIPCKNIQVLNIPKIGITINALGINSEWTCSTSYRVQGSHMFCWITYNANKEYKPSLMPYAYETDNYLWSWKLGCILSTHIVTITITSKMYNF